MEDRGMIAMAKFGNNRKKSEKIENSVKTRVDGQLAFRSGKILLLT
jgi:hypothetical protein